ncbi:MAG: hypothetical protein E7562_04010 [Ruminococcaceae bacterium]|nr:hypothetical protein [Oscillospiraceae bacterium]
MKISQMLLREDFYDINKKTLDNFYGSNENEKTKLYIYPKLNAIVTSKPSKAVRKYLYTEFNINTSFIKRIVVRLYAFLLLHSFGLFAAKKCIVNAEVGNDVLIYPCNKKYRILNFSKGIIDVIIKDGFKDGDLKHEINFRSRDDLADFVPQIIKYDQNGYSEKIIDGCPLARKSVGFEKYRDDAYKMYTEYYKVSEKKVKPGEYALKLIEEISDLSFDSPINQALLEGVLTRLKGILVDGDREIALSFSHGDLQAGNIWIENSTDKIYIIDWESCRERSIYYDKAVLYHGLRPLGVEHYLNENLELQEKAIVLLEDIIFQINERKSLSQLSEEKWLESYLKTVENYLNGLK